MPQINLTIALASPYSVTEDWRVQWIFTALEESFKCKSAEMLMDFITEGYLGMAIQAEGDRIYMSMAKYNENACMILRIEGGSWVPTN